MAQTVFPESAVPSARSFKPGSYAVQTFRAMSGAETRILYGDKIIGSELTLSYSGIADGRAAEFIDHYTFCKGTFDTFKIRVENKKVRAGWGSEVKYLTASAGTDDTGLEWRYKEAPVITNIYPGYSNVTVTLIGVNRA